MTLDELREDVALNLTRYLTPTELKKLRDCEKLHDDEYDAYEAHLINKVFTRLKAYAYSNSYSVISTHSPLLSIVSSYVPSTKNSQVL